MSSGAISFDLSKNLPSVMRCFQRDAHLSFPVTIGVHQGEIGMTSLSYETLRLHRVWQMFVMSELTTNYIGILNSGSQA